MKPIELKIIMRNETKQGFAEINKDLQKFGKTINQVSADFVRRINEQRDVVKLLEKDLANLEKQAAKLGSGMGENNLKTELEATKRILEEEKLALEALQQQVKETAQSYTDMATNLAQMKDAMSGMTEGSEEYLAMMQQMIELQEKVGESSEEKKQPFWDTKNVDALADALGTVDNALTMGVEAASLFGIEQESLTKIQTRLQSVMAITTGLQKVMNATNTESYFSTLMLSGAQKALTVINRVLGTSFAMTGVAAKVLMATLTLGLSVAITGIMFLIDKFVAKQKEKKEATEAAAQAAKDQAQAEESARKSAASGVTSQITEYKRLQTAYKELGDSLDKRKKFIKDNQDAFDKLGVSISNVAEADNLFIGNEQAFLNSLSNRALAAAAMEQASEKYTQAIAKMMEAEQYQTTGEDLKKAQKMTDDWLEEELKKHGTNRAQSEKVITTDFGKNNTERWVQELRAQYPEVQKKAIEIVTSRSKNQIEDQAYFKIEDGDKILKTSSNYYKSAETDLSDANITPTKVAPAPEDNTKLETQQRIAAELLQMQQSNAQRDIELTKDERERKRKQIEHEYEKDKALIDAKEKEWQAAQEKGDIELTPEHTKAIEDWRKSLEEKKENQTKDLENAGIQDTLSKYKTYYQTRLEILEKFQKDRKILEDSKASQEQLGELDRQQNNELELIDRQFAMREEDFQGWADTIVGLSIDQLGKLLHEAEQELERMEFLNPDSPQIAKIRAQIATYKKEIGSKNKKNDTEPDGQSTKKWQDLSKTLRKCSGEFESLGKEVGGTVGAILSAAGGLATTTMEMIDSIMQLANWSVTATQMTAQGASKAIQTVEKASVILAVISAALQIATKIASLFSSDKDNYEDAKKAYESYVAVLDQVIDKQKELVKTMTGEGAKQSYEYAMQLLEKSENAARQMGKEYQDSGKKSGFAGIGKKDAKGKRQRKEMSTEGWNEAKAALGSDFYSYGIGEGNMNGLFDLSVEQLVKLKSEAPLFWSKLREDTRGYLDQIIECGDEASELMSAWRESMTGITFDELRNSLSELAQEADLTFEKIQESFEDHMSKAIMNFIQKKYLSDQLEKWYGDFANAMSGDKLTKEDADALRDEYERIARTANEKYIEAMKSAGLNIPGAEEESEEEETQSGRAGSFTTMSQEQGTKLEGLFTSLQMHTSNMDANIQDISGQLYQAMDQWTAITENTAYCRHLEQIAGDIAEMKRDGIKAL